MFDESRFCEYCGKEYNWNYSKASDAYSFCSKACERNEEIRLENELRQEEQELKHIFETANLRAELEQEREKREYNEGIIKCKFCGEEYRRINGFPSEDIMRYHHLVGVLNTVQRTEQKGKRFTSQGLKNLIQQYDGGIEIDFCSKECRTKYKQDNVEEIESLKKRSDAATEWLSQQIVIRQKEEEIMEQKRREQAAKEAEIREQKQKEQAAREHQRRVQEGKKLEEDRKAKVKELEDSIRRANSFDDLPGGSIGDYAYRWVDMTKDEAKYLDDLYWRQRKKIQTKETVKGCFIGLWVVGVSVLLSYMVCTFFGWGVVGGFWTFVGISVTVLMKEHSNDSIVSKFVEAALGIAIVWVLVMKFG